MLLFYVHCIWVIISIQLLCCWVIKSRRCFLLNLLVFLVLFLYGMLQGLHGSLSPFCISQTVADTLADPCEYLHFLRCVNYSTKCYSVLSIVRSLRLCNVAFYRCSVSAYTTDPKSTLSVTLQKRLVITSWLQRVPPNTSESPATTLAMHSWVVYRDNCSQLLSYVGPIVVGTRDCD